MASMADSMTLLKRAWLASRASSACLRSVMSRTNALKVVVFPLWIGVIETSTGNSCPSEWIALISIRRFSTVVFATHRIALQAADVSFAEALWNDRFVQRLSHRALSG